MKDLEWIKTRLIAHRGLHTNSSAVPENSKKAFALAVAKGYGIECDVNLLKDGTVIVFHDKNLLRMCNDDRYLKDLTAEDMKKVRLLGTEEVPMTLREFLDFIDGRVPLLIELKPFGPYKPLCEAFMKTMEGYQGPWAMHSFQPFAVLWFKKNHPEVIRGQISEYFRQDKHMNKLIRFAMKHLLFNLLTKPDFVNYGIHDMPNRFVDRAQRHGIVVIAYASRNQAQFDMCKNRYSNSVFELFEPKQ
jgi:glycerophosphoryl diester phosphodiesterase